MLYIRASFWNPIAVHYLARDHLDERQIRVSFFFGNTNAGLLDRTYRGGGTTWHQTLSGDANAKFPQNREEPDFEYYTLNKEWRIYIDSFYLGSRRSHSNDSA